MGFAAAYLAQRGRRPEINQADGVIWLIVAVVDDFRDDDDDWDDGWDDDGDDGAGREGDVEAQRGRGRDGDEGRNLAGAGHFRGIFDLESDGSKRVLWSVVCGLPFAALSSGSAVTVAYCARNQLFSGVLLDGIRATCLVLGAFITALEKLVWRETRRARRRPDPALRNARGQGVAAAAGAAAIAGAAAAAAAAARNRVNGNVDVNVDVDVDVDANGNVDVDAFGNVNVGANADVNVGANANANVVGVVHGVANGKEHERGRGGKGVAPSNLNGNGSVSVRVGVPARADGIGSIDAANGPPRRAIVKDNPVA